MDDATIINLFWARDEAAIPAAQDKYGAYCRAIALGILADARDADECVNDALLRLWRAIPPERPRSLRAFLGRITRNLAINALRDASRQKRGGGEASRQKRGGGEAALALDELAACADISTSPERAVADAEITACIDRWLASLPREHRVAFVRRYWYLDSVPALAARMGWTKSKTASLLMRLRASLREALISEDITL